MTTSASPTLRRLNGRLQACDPCRRRKVACDNGQPVCNRCKKRKQTSACAYTVSSSSVVHTNQALASRSLPTKRRASGPSEWGEASKPGSPDSQGLPSRTPGYLGYSSYCSVFEETRGDLTARATTGASISNHGDEATSFDEASTFRGGQQLGAIPPETMQKCLAVLRHLPPRHVIRNHHVDFREVAIFPQWNSQVAQDILESVYAADEFEHVLRGDGGARRSGALEDMARMVCFNTAKPLVDDEVGYRRWIAQFCGRNLRWESIGLLFLFWIWTNTRQHDQSYRAQEMARWKASRERISLCIELCEEFSDGNFLLVHLLHQRVCLESRCSGDASRQTWKDHAEAVACLTFLGLHDEPADGAVPYRPSFHSEMKRMVTSSLYNTDKTIQAFTGRPPQLSRRFVTTPLPLDISEAVLFGDWTLSTADIASTLDADGWNKQGQSHHATFSRGRRMLGHFKEAIIEIAGGRGDQAAVANLLQLRADMARAVAGFPRVLVYEPAALSDPAVEADRLYTAMLIRMEVLQNEFLLGRLLDAGGHRVEGNLLGVSYELVTLTVNLWARFDRFGKWQEDFEWLLIGHGAPAGGILCKELLKPTFQQGNSSSSSDNPDPQPPLVSRSSIIQKLSLLVGFLDWVDPSAPNANLCRECKSVIQLVLDQNLNPATAASLSTLADGGGVVNNMLEVPDTTMDWGFSGQLDFNFEMLDSFDWLVPETRSS